MLSSLRGLAGLVIVGLALASCTGGDEDEYGTVPTSGPSSSKSAGSPAPTTGAPSPTTSMTVEEQILAQYKRFLTDVWPKAQAAPADARAAILAKAVTEPQLSGNLKTLQTRDIKGQVGYGVARLIKQTVYRKGEQAVVDGCTDLSKVGVQDQKSGKKLTVGPSRNPVQLSLKLENDGVWRIFDYLLLAGTC